jgi:excisionase family DNA binding protein
MLSNESMAKKEPKQQELSELLTMQETCKILKCHPNTLRQWDKKGILEAVRFGERRDRRYKKSDIIKLLNKKRSK